MGPPLSFTQFKVQLASAELKYNVLNLYANIYVPGLTLKLYTNTCCDILG